MTDKKTHIETIVHSDERINIPTPELAPLMAEEDVQPIRVSYENRNPDLDPQLIWRGKDIDQEAVMVDAPPIYLQEQIHPKAIIEDLRAGNQRNGEGSGASLFDHFGVTEDDREAEVEFYKHSQKWSNRMILGDGLQVMASLAEREGLKGQVQAIYIDPPYGIKFNSNFQWSTTSRDVKDGKLDHLTREPEQVKAFRDTWRDEIHSYLGYLRDRLVAARELLTESGSCFVQIGDENVHRVRALMDEVFGEERFVTAINVQTAPYATSNYLPSVVDTVLWYSKNGTPKYRGLFKDKTEIKSIGLYRQALHIDGATRSLLDKDEIESGPRNKDFRQYRLVSLISQGSSSTPQPFNFSAKTYVAPSNSHWKTRPEGDRKSVV